MEMKLYNTPSRLTDFTPYIIPLDPSHCRPSPSESPSESATQQTPSRGYRSRWCIRPRTLNGTLNEINTCLAIVSDTRGRPSPPFDMSLPESVAQAVWIRKAWSFAGTAILLYDYLLTLDQEITYVWNAPWTKTKATFLVNRYGNLFGQIFILVEETGWVARNSQGFCRCFEAFITIFPFFSLETIHILVILRARAIWGCTRRTASILISIYLTYFLLMFGFMIFIISLSQYQELQYLDTVGICIYAIPSSFKWPLITTVTISLGLDIILFGITMWNLWKQLREYGHLYPSSLVHILIRDASIFFSVSILYSIISVLMFKLYADDPKSFILESFGTPILSIAGQRLVLNLRGLKVRTYSQGAISAEVDRQLAALDEMEPVSRQSRGRSASGGLLELELLGLEDFEESVQQEIDAIMAQGNADAEAEVGTSTGTGMDAGAIELRALDGARRRSKVSQSEEITEVLRLSDERRA